MDKVLCVNQVILTPNRLRGNQMAVFCGYGHCLLCRLESVSMVSISVAVRRLYKYYLALPPIPVLSKLLIVYYLLYSVCFNNLSLKPTSSSSIARQKLNFNWWWCDRGRGLWSKYLL